MSEIRTWIDQQLATIDSIRGASDVDEKRRMIEQSCFVFMRDALPILEGWQPMTTAPKTGPVFDVQLRYERAGREIIEIGHWAHGDGDGMMPEFGPAWFKKLGTAFIEIHGTPTHWKPLKTAADALDAMSAPKIITARDREQVAILAKIQERLRRIYDSDWPLLNEPDINRILVEGVEPELSSLLDAREAPTPTWQPIETAPMDGRCVLVYPVGVFGADQAGAAYWDRDAGYECWRHFGDGERLDPQPTHWTSLPAPPSADAREATRPVEVSGGALAGAVDLLGHDSGAQRIELTDHEVTDLILSGQAYTLDGKVNIIDTTGRLRALEECEEQAKAAPPPHDEPETK